MLLPMSSGTFYFVSYVVQSIKRRICLSYLFVSDFSTRDICNLNVLSYLKNTIVLPFFVGEMCDSKSARLFFSKCDFEIVHNNSKAALRQDRNKFCYIVFYNLGKKH